MSELELVADAPGELPALLEEGSEPGGEEDFLSSTRICPPNRANSSSTSSSGAYGALMIAGLWHE